MASARPRPTSTPRSTEARARSTLALCAATVGGLAFGIAFAATSNIYVPMVMHLVVDVVGFGACHWQVTRASVDEQRALLNSDAPIAKQLAAVLGPRVAASQEQAAAAAAGGEV